VTATLSLPRVVAAETLDHLPPDDPAAQRSRRDLARVHLAMGTRAIMASGWRALLRPAAASDVVPGGRPLRVLELGAGDGTLLLGLARKLAPQWPRVKLTLLDRQPVVNPATLAAYSSLGWDVQVQTIDVLEWASAPAAGLASPPHWDLISTTLFLHHFEGAALQRLLAAVAARTRHFFACEPSRDWLALAGSHLIGAIGANHVTREDAVLSVHAGFRDNEIGAQWPGDGSRHWQLREYRAGLFSHCFSARLSSPDGTE
jgi:SAM-dependent methyltransferase